jgi:hypothetical protein
VPTTSPPPALDLEPLHSARRDTVSFVDVPELGFATVRGRGSPDGPDFAAAVQALYTVSYGTHFLAKRQRGSAPKVQPLEALWWVDDAAQQALVVAAAVGDTTPAGADGAHWRWQAMILQPPPLDEAAVLAAVAQARRKPLPALDLVRYETWEEGLCAQLLHVGPFAEEGPSIVRLHRAIDAAGLRPRGRHHEIYLSDPRRCAPERLRTLLRQPVAPA